MPTLASLDTTNMCFTGIHAGKINKVFKCLDMMSLLTGSQTYSHVGSCVMLFLVPSLLVLFETGYLFVVLAVLNLIVQTILASNSQAFKCLCVLGRKVCHTMLYLSR